MDHLQKHRSPPARAGLLSRRQAMLAAIVPMAARTWAAEPPSSTGQDATFSADVKVINVFASVRDNKGKIVHDLTKDDFALIEDGRAQQIRYFSQQSSLPLTLGLLVDTSGSERRMIATEKDASATFLQKVLRPDQDKAFLIHFDSQVELLQDLTSSREALLDSLNQLAAPEAPNGPRSGGGGYPGGSGGGYPGGGYPGGGGGYPGGRGGRGGSGGHMGGGTLLFDAVYLAGDELMKKQSGRKALVLLTDGLEMGSKTSLEGAITAAQRSDTLVYCVRIADDSFHLPGGGGFGGPGMGGGGWGRRGGMGGPGMGRGGNGPGGRAPRELPDGKKILQQIARETGGGYYEVSKKKTVEEIYAEIEEDLRNQYSLGYSSDQAAGSGAYRKIQLAVKSRKDAVVRTRDGYYPGS